MTKTEMIVERFEESENTRSSQRSLDRYQKVKDSSMSTYNKLTTEELLPLVLRDDSDSQKVLYYLLTVKLRGGLETVYRHVFFPDNQGTLSFKSFDDYLSDFFLYLFEDQPKNKTEKIHYYHLTTIKEGKKIDPWIAHTFHNFLVDEQAIMSKLHNSLEEYKRQLIEGKRTEQGITIMHIAFAISQFNQNETELDRYIFFRSIFRGYSGFHLWPNDELDDRETAELLGMTHGAFRTRSSRLMAKICKEIKNITNAKIATLDKKALDLAKKIYEDSECEIDHIIKDLMTQAEEELPQFMDIYRARERKRATLHREILHDRMVNDSSRIAFDRTRASVISIFENIIGWKK